MHSNPNRYTRATGTFARIRPYVLGLIVLPLLLALSLSVRG